MKTTNTSTTAAVALHGSKEEQNTLSQKVTDELMELFGIDKTKNNIHGILESESNLDSKDEVIKMEEDLNQRFRKILGKELYNKDILELNKANPLTLSSVMEELEKEAA